MKKPILALLTCVLVIGGGEAVLRLLGLPAEGPDPLERLDLPPETWIDWRDGGDGRIFEPCGEGQVCVRERMLRLGVLPDRVPVARAPGEERIFALGGSTTRGLPYERADRAFPGRLEALLREARPGREIRVVNVGVPGMDSVSFLRVAREALDLGATALLVYAGHNEIRGRTFDACVAPYRRRADRVVRSVRLLAWIRSLVAPPSELDADAIEKDLTECMGSAAVASLESAAADRPAPPDPDGGRIDPLGRMVVATFRSALEGLVRLAADAPVPLWLGVPAVNLHPPPDYDVPWPGLGRDARSRLRAFQQAPLPQELRSAEAALALDPRFAPANWAAGTARLAAGDVRAARRLLARAVDHDLLGQRATRQLREVVRALCRAHPATVRCVDVEAAVAGAAAGTLPGEDLFVDHVHPRYPEGVEVIARAFADAMLGYSSSSAGAAAGSPGSHE